MDELYRSAAPRSNNNPEVSGAPSSDKSDQPGTIKRDLIMQATLTKR
jgi:hypothetical protein